MDSAIPVVLFDLLGAIGNPLKVTFMTCWEPMEKIRFHNVLNERYITTFADDHISQFVEDINDHQTFLVVDLNCSGSTELLRSAKQLLYMKYRWMILNSAFLGDWNSSVTKDEQLEFYSTELKSLPLLVSSEIFIIIKASPTYFEVKQLYKIYEQESLSVEDFGIWDSGTFRDVRLGKVTSIRRLNLNGHTLKASMVVTDPETLNHLEDYKDKHIDTITKVNFILTNALVQYMGAVVNYSVVSTWGYLNTSSGEWSGMIGELSSRTADLGASPLFFTTDRIAVIEYVAMTSATRSKFIFRSPKLSYTENVFLLPFDDFVWLCIVVIIFLASGLLVITALAEWRFPHSAADSNDPSLLQPNFRDSLMMIYGATCQQGSSTVPKSIAARSITFISFVILMFLYVCYSANIVALLQSPSTKIQSLDDLLMSRLKLGVHDTVFNRYYFTHTTERTRKAIYERKILQPDGSESFIELEDGIDRIRQGLYAFHVEQGVGYKVMSETYQEDEKCGIQEIQYLQVIDPYYAIQKNSSFKEHVKIGLFRLNEHGIQHRENTNLYTKKPRCTGGGGKFVPVSLVDIEPALLAMVWGGGFTAAVFVIESIWWKAWQIFQDWKRSRVVKFA
ncbi:ionotropic receptor 75a-like [Uranotaenia lowii]|uniref:ionotropic receptor 75a-like n=1 Tax=Uranotaenia lowii TaxID=190385 RepID=UPI002478B8D4|nr:ionotropic receptor 75a-like [Uranotaenia lowii]